MKGMKFKVKLAVQGRIVKCRTYNTAATKGRMIIPLNKTVFTLARRLTKVELWWQNEKSQLATC